MIRHYEPGDREEVLACIRDLQDHERAVEPDRLSGEAVAVTHLDHLLTQCAKRDGVLLVAVEAGRIVGFACVWSREEFGEHLASPATSGYVSDLFVAPGDRRRGLGRQLLSAAEQFARGRGCSILAVDALTGNAAARRFYAGAGCREYQVRYVKVL